MYSISFIAACSIFFLDDIFIANADYNNLVLMLCISHKEASFNHPSKWNSSFTWVDSLIKISNSKVNSLIFLNTPPTNVNDNISLLTKVDYNFKDRTFPILTLSEYPRIINNNHNDIAISRILCHSVRYTFINNHSLEIIYINYLLFFDESLYPSKYGNIYNFIDIDLMSTINVDLSAIAWMLRSGISITL